MTQRWPSRLWIVRHGESAGNVAREEALAARLDRIAIDGRDVDVPLSVLGEQQSEALGHWFAARVAQERPNILITSPYQRARATAEIFRAACGFGSDQDICSDERLREKEFGILDGLTRTGITSLLPDQAEFRRVLGKFYHRPPGGESWCDVILRLRSFLDTLSLHHSGDRVMLVTHQVVVLCLRYIIEGLDEAEILAIDAQEDVANCAVTEYRLDPAAGMHGRLVLKHYNFTAPVSSEVPVTRAPDLPVARR